MSIESEPQSTPENMFESGTFGLLLVCSIPFTVFIVILLLAL